MQSNLKSTALFQKDTGNYFFVAGILNESGMLSKRLFQVVNDIISMFQPHAHPYHGIGRYRPLSFTALPMLPGTLDTSQASCPLNEL